jgi:hypothetical protein
MNKVIKLLINLKLVETISKKKLSQKITTIGYGVFVFILYWLYGNRPLVAQPIQWADDGLYLHQAESILQWLYHGCRGPWLGGYEPFLLSKAPMYAIFLALINGLGIPLRIAEFACLIALPFLFRRAWKPILPKMSNLAFILITLILIALPQLWFSLRLLRDVLHSILCISCLIFVSGYLIRTRMSYPIKSQRFWAILTGFSFALCYLNREEVIWLAPLIILAFCFSLMSSFRKVNILNSLSPLLLGIIIFLLPIAIVAELNSQSYGAYITTMRRSNAFTKLYKCLTSLEPISHERFVPISTQTRALAYTVSPTFAKLGFFLEGHTYDNLAYNPEHNKLNGRPTGTREFYVSNFEFALLGSAYYAGAKTAGSTERMFSTITSEIKQAIHEKKINAGEGGIGLLAAPLPGDYKSIITSSVLSLYQLFTFRGIKPQKPEFSSGEPSGIIRMSNMTRSPLSPTAETEVYSINTKLTTLQIFIVFYMNRALFVFIVVKRKIDSKWITIAILVCLLVMGTMGFSLAMGILNVLGWPHLQWPYAYNIMGYAPLSVLISTGVVIISLWLQNTERRIGFVNSMI